LAGGLNLYGFANGDPVNFSDPFGLQGCPTVGPPPPECEALRPLKTVNKIAEIGALVTGGWGLGRALLGRLLARGLTRAAVTGSAEATAGATEEVAANANKLSHIFGNASHHLDDLVGHFGGQQEAFNAVQTATDELVASKGLTGVFEQVVNVAGQDVTVRGRVIEGVARIGTFFIR